MKVRELIANLKDFDPELEVVVDATLDDGCTFRILVERVDLGLRGEPLIIEGVEA